MGLTLTALWGYKVTLCPNGGEIADYAVAYVYRQGIMAGTSVTPFEPNATLSRAMVAQILYNLEGRPDIPKENLDNPYADVDAQDWCVDAVYWSRISGVATGYENNTFRPDKAVTREELAQMLYTTPSTRRSFCPLWRT